MDEWEAKYKILASGIASKEAIEAVDCLWEKATSLSKNSVIPLSTAVDLIIRASRLAMTEFESKTPPRTFHGQLPPQTILGFPVALHSWMPSQYAAIGNGESLVITDLRTGKIKHVTKEDMERVVSKFFAEEEK